MKINIKTIGIDSTPSFKAYIEEKVGSLARLVKRFDETGEAAVWVEVRRSTKHHKHGDVFWAAADLRLPKNVLRAEAEASDARAAVDGVRAKLQVEIGKYRTRFVEISRKQASRK